MSFTSLIEFGPLQTNAVELISVAFGLASVWSMKKESILAFPFGIINVLGYIFLSWIKTYYALAGINLFFAMMSIYGWYNWSRSDQDAKVVVISYLSGKERWVNLFVFAISFIVIWFLLSSMTDSSIPFWDALTTSLYIVAMWMLSQKKIENWIAWIIGDTISVFIYGLQYGNNQANYFSSFQFAVFTVIAVFGYLEWKGKSEKRRVKSEK
ncbi:MAG: nicotinamide riboside transporter PnuC [Bacteroidota bacterium]